MTKTIKAVITTGKSENNQAFDVVVGSGAKDQATRIKAVQGARYVLQDPLAKDVAPEKVRSKRVGKDLHVAFDDASEADLIVENYYEVNPVADGYAGLYGRAENGSLYEYASEDTSAAAAVAELKDGDAAVLQVLGAHESGEAFALSAMPVAAVGVSSLGLMGGLLTVAAGGLGGASGGAAAVPVLGVTSTYAGTGTAGNVIKLYNGNTVVASGTVNPDGTWRIGSETPADAILSMTETSAAGESAKVTVSSVELAAAQLNGSAAPTVHIITDADNNGYVNAAELKIGGGKYIAQVSFDASKVNIGDKVVVSDGMTTRTVVLTQPDLKTGFVSVAFSAPREGGSLTVTAALKDSTNSYESLQGKDSALLDTIAPNGGVAPKVEIITDANNDGVVNTTELAGKQSFSVKASFDKATVFVGDKVVFNNGSIEQTVVLKATDITNGYVTTVFVKPKTEGGSLTVNAYVQDIAGQVSAKSSNDVAVLDTKAPSTTVKIDGISDDTGVAGDFITSDSNGLTVQATLSAALVDGQKLWYSNDNGATWTNITSEVTGKTVSHVDAKLTSTNTVKLRVGSATDNFGVAASQLITIDTAVPNGGVAPTVEITTDTNNDGIVNLLELGGSSTFSIKGSFDKTKVKLGDKFIFNDGTDHEVALTATDIANGFVTTTLAKPADGASLNVTGKLQSITGINSAVSASDSAKLVLVDNSKATVSITTIDDVANGSNDTGVSNSDFITSDSTLIVKGTVTGFDGAAGDKVRVQIFDATNTKVAELNVTPDASGNWSFDNKANTLADGKYSIKAVVVNANGQALNTLVAQDLVIDTKGNVNQPNDAPDDNTSASVAITGMANDTGVSSSDFITSDNKLTYSGTVTGFTANGDKVKVELLAADGVTVVATDYITPNNNQWTWAYETLQADGKYTVRATIVDTAGNRVNVAAAGQAKHDVVVDTKGDVNQPNDAPDVNTSAKVTIDAITDDTGVSGSDFITKDDTLTYSGTVTSFTANGDMVKLELVGNDGKVIETAYVNPSNNAWSWAPKNAQATGQYELRATIVDKADNTVTGSTGDTQIVIVDKDGNNNVDPTKPVNPVNPVVPQEDPNATKATVKITGISDDSGVSTSDFVTNDATLFIKGSVSGFDASTKDMVLVQIKDSTNQVVATQYLTPDASGNWTLNNTANALADGKYTITADIVDVAGNPVKTGVPQLLVVDTNNGGKDPSANPENGPTNPTDPNATSASITLAGITNDNGVSATDYITSDGTLVISGAVANFSNTAGAAGDKVRVRIVNDKQEVVAEKYMDPTSANGTWSFDNQAQTLEDGNYTIKSAITDKAGNVVKAAADQALVISSNAAPSSTTVTISSISDDTGVSNTDFITKDSTLVIKGAVNSEYNASTEKVLVQILKASDGSLVTSGFATVDANGFWTLDKSGVSLSDDKYTIRAVITNAAGTAEVASTVKTQTLVVDNAGNDNPGNNPTHTDPNTGAVLSIVSIHDAVNDSYDSGPSNNDFITNDKTIVVKGTVTGFSAIDGGAGDKVRVQIFNDKLEVVAEQYITPDASGNWTLNNKPNSLADGKYSIKAVVVDAAGNPVNTLVSHDLVIDTNQGGTDPKVNPGNNPTTDPNATDASIAITGISEDTGVSATDYITSDGTLIISGTVGNFSNTAGAAGDKVRVQILNSDRAVVAQTYVDPTSNTWSFDNTAKTLIGGNYTIKAAIVDAADNVVKAAADQALVISGGNNNNPNASAKVDIATISDDLGVSQSDFVTSDTTLTYSGTISGFTANGDVVKLELVDKNGAVIDTNYATPAASGAWSWARSATHTDGQYELRATLVDVSGAPVVGATTDKQIVIVDTDGGKNTDPTKPVTPSNPVVPEVDVNTSAMVEIKSISTDTGVSTSDFITSDTTLTYSGTVTNFTNNGDAVKLVLVDSANQVIETAYVVPSNGTWSWVPMNPQTVGQYELRATVVDKAGNTVTGAATDSQIIMIDTTGPIPVPPTDDPTKPVAGQVGLVIDKVTADNTVNLVESNGNVTITGKAYGDFTAGDVVTLRVNGVDASGTVAADGSFSVNVAGSNLALDSDFAIEASLVAHDKAGNPGTITVKSTYNVDLTAPNGNVAPEVTITTDSNDDGYVNAEELSAANNAFRVSASFDNTKVEVGDIMVFSDGTTTKEVSLTQNDIDNGFAVTSFAKPAENASLAVTAFVKDVAGNATPVSLPDTAMLDTNAPNKGMAPKLEIEDDADNNGIIDPVEIGASNLVSVKASFEVNSAEVGDELMIKSGDTTTTFTLTQADIAAGWVLAYVAKPVAGDVLDVTAWMEDKAKNITTISSDTAEVSSVLTLKGTEAFDLNSVSLRISTLLEIDMATDTGVNTVNLSLGDVLAVPMTGDLHVLKLTGGANDFANINLDAWTHTAPPVTSNGRTYEVFDPVSGAHAQLLIDQLMWNANHVS